MNLVFCTCSELILLLNIQLIIIRYQFIMLHVVVPMECLVQLDVLLSEAEFLDCFQWESVLLARLVDDRFEERMHGRNCFERG